MNDLSPSQYIAIGIRVAQSMPEALALAEVIERMALRQSRAAVKAHRREHREAVQTKNVKRLLQTIQFAAARRIREATAAYYLIPLEEMQRSRSKMPSEARHVAWHITRRHLDLSLVQIGSLYGGHDHSTVIYGIEKIERLLLHDRQLRVTVKEITAICEPSTDVVRRELRWEKVA